MAACVCLCGHGLHFSQISDRQGKQKAIQQHFILFIFSPKKWALGQADICKDGISVYLHPSLY